MPFSSLVRHIAVMPRNKWATVGSRCNRINSSSFSSMNRWMALPPHTRHYAAPNPQDMNNPPNEQKPVWLDLLLRLLEEQHRSTQQAIGSLKESQTLQFAHVNKRIDDVNIRIDDLGTGLNKRIDDVASHVNYLLTLMMLGFAGSGLYLAYQQVHLTKNGVLKDSPELKGAAMGKTDEDKSALPAPVTHNLST